MTLSPGQEHAREGGEPDVLSVDFADFAWLHGFCLLGSYVIFASYTLAIKLSFPFLGSLQTIVISSLNNESSTTTYVSCEFVVPAIIGSINQFWRNCDLSKA